MSETPLVLLADDDDAIRSGLAAALQRAGFRTVEARNGLEALKLVEQHTPDVIALDILMPQLDGRETVRRLRQANNWTPIIMLTQISATGEKIVSLEEGADDFLNKPFDSYELVARLRALLRRQQVAGRPAQLASTLSSDMLKLERETQRVWLAGREIALSNKAFGVLAHLMSRPNVIVSREQLLDQVWGWDDPTGMRTVDVRIAEIRRKLGEEAAELIETIPGEGYRFVGNVKTG
ncbi:MAG: response regulator transcription factor [Anaerolineales bacterium]|nr:response regulator transcription factor [Anaerolineales bacterium]